MYFEDSIDEAKYSGHLFGLGATNIYQNGFQYESLVPQQILAQQQQQQQQASLNPSSSANLTNPTSTTTTTSNSNEGNSMMITSNA